MLRRSLIILLAGAILTLAFTAGYALLPVRGPEDLLRDASAWIARGEHLAAAELLDRSESAPAFAQSADLRRQLWRLRLQAHRALDVPTRALQDVENLMQDGDTAVSLRMDRVYYLAKLGQGEEARKAGVEVAKANPTLARAQELAGEACKVAYTPRLRAAAARVRSDVGFEREQQAVAALLEMLYRPEGDPSVDAALRRLRALYLAENRLAQAWPGFHEELADLRADIQTASLFFLQALELIGQDRSQRGSFFAAAFHGVAYGLQQGGRNDDLDAQAEIYFGAHTHRWRTDAAVAAATVRYNDGLYESVVDIAERCAPVESLTQDLAANRFTPAIRSLLVVRCLSLFRLARIEELTKLAAAIQTASKNSPPLNALPGLAWGLANTLAKRRENTTLSLQWYCDISMREVAPQDGQDPLELLMPVLLDSMSADGKPATDVFAKIEAWSQARPGNASPLLTRARWQLRLSQDAAAMATATAILQDRPTDEDALRLLAAAADQSYKASQQDGASLVLHCLQRNTDRPDSPPHPVCYLLCAEAALVQQHPMIARACARLAFDQFPWSSWPLLLQARAEAMLGSPELAIETLDRLLDLHPDASAAVQLAFELRVQNDLPVRQLLAQAVATMAGSRLVLTELLRSALEDDGPTLETIAKQAFAAADAGAEILALAASAFAKRKDVTTARAALTRARASTDSSAPRVTRALLAAELDCLVAESHLVDDELLAAATDRFLATASWAGPGAARQMVSAARKLETVNRRQAAARLLDAALAAGDAIEIRDGSTHAFAGDLALAQGRITTARHAYTAAVSFEDGGIVAERLARLELLAGAPHRAVAAYATAATTADAALAMLLGSTDALRIARERIAKSPDDLLVAAPFLLLNDAKSNPLADELRAAPPAAQREALTACTLLDDPLLASTAGESAAAASSQAPRCFVFAMLHARAMLAAGDSTGAAAIHARLYDEGRRSPLLWGEVARGALAGGYLPPTAILAELQVVAQKAPSSLSADVQAMLALRAAAEAERLGQPDVALGIRADAFRFYPIASRATVKDAESLRAAGRAVAAVELLHALQPSATAENRTLLAKTLYETAITVAGELAPASGQALRTQAMQDLLAGIAPGVAFRFLASSADTLAKEPEERAVAMARAVLFSACKGDAAWSDAELALKSIQTRMGPVEALSLVNEALTLHPAASRLWTARVVLRSELGEDDLLLDDARALLACFSDPDFALELITIAAELRKTATPDKALFEALPESMRNGARGRLAEGLLALRVCEVERAETALAACDTKSPTLLYARALANLMRREPGGRAAAKSLFEELVASYPSSSLARNAGSFARQLGPN